MANRTEKQAKRPTAAGHVPFWRSLQTKFALTYIAIIAAVLVLLNTYPVLVSQDLVFQSKEKLLLNNQASVVAWTVANRTLTAENVKGIIGSLHLPDVDRLMVTDAAGRILYDSKSVPSGTPDGEAPVRYALFREVTYALRGNDVFHREFRDGAFRCQAAVPVMYRNMCVGAVYVYECDKTQGALMLGIQQNLRSISIVICVVAIIMSMVFSKALTRRIADLLRAVRIVREGEYSHRVAISGGDELSQLAGEFNELTGRLQTTEEVRRRFVSDASHELKTPLASIRLLTDSILQNEGMDAETAREFVTDIGDESERLTRITEKLLTLTRMDTAPPMETGPVDVKVAVEKVQRMLAPLARAVEVSLQMDLSDGCIVRATEDDLYQITFNLMENAVKYNLPGGSVAVTLWQTDDTVSFRVDDTGVGIPEDDLAKIFDRFYRVDKARSRAAGGTGLGLSIVRDTARQHGGAVTARLREGGGSSFEVTFPRWRERRRPDARGKESHG